MPRDAADRLQGGEILLSRYLVSSRVFYLPLRRNGENYTTRRRKRQPPAPTGSDGARVRTGSGRRSRQRPPRFAMPPQLVPVAIVPFYAIRPRAKWHITVIGITGRARPCRGGYAVIEFFQCRGRFAFLRNLRRFRLAVQCDKYLIPHRVAQLHAPRTPSRQTRRTVPQCFARSFPFAMSHN